VHIAAAVGDGLGIKDASKEEIKTLLDDPDRAAYTFADMISRRSQTGWTTHGHSAADVNIYSSDPAVAKALVGNHENTEVGKFLGDYLGVDVDAVTKELREKGTGLKVMGSDGKEVGWMGKVPEEGERLDGQTHMKSYGGEYRKRHLLHGRGCDCGH
jgi:alkaline phosphatase